jgi:hypothetical protein
MNTCFRSFVLFCFVSFASLVSFASAQPFAGGQMPDPKAMSGTPLPVGDVPVGTATARVIRGQLTNPLEGQTVELTGAGGPRTAKTDSVGRATFSGLPPGSRVKMSVTVGSETIASQEFEVPNQGGIRVMLVATDAESEAKAATDRKLAEEPPVKGTVVLGDQSRLVIEVGDDALNVFNMMQIVNTAKRRVKTDAPLVFELPADAVGAGMLEGSTPNAIAAGRRVTVNGPFAPGATVVQFAYSIPLGPESVTLSERIPAPLPQVSLIVQKAPGMELSSPQIKDHRDMAAEGQTYIVGQGSGLRAGDTVTLTLSGLPHRPTWPRNLTLLLSSVILAAGVWGVTRGRVPTPEKDRRRELQSQREALFGQLTSLEAERRKGKTDPAAYAARREQLVTALEDLYAGLDHEAVA